MSAGATLNEMLEEARRAKEATPVEPREEVQVDPGIPDDHDSVPTGSIPLPRIVRRLLGVGG